MCQARARARASPLRSRADRAFHRSAGAIEADRNSRRGFWVMWWCWAICFDEIVGDINVSFVSYGLELSIWDNEDFID